MRTYLRHKIENVIDVKELIALEYLDFEGKYKNYEEKHAFWEICYVEEGRITLSLDGEDVSLSSGELVFIAPDVVHSYASEKGNQNRAFVICFESFSVSMRSLSSAKFRLDEGQKKCIDLVIDESKNTFYMNSCDLLETVAEPNFGGAQAIILQLEYLILCLMRRLSAEDGSAIVFLRDDRFYADLVNVIIRYFSRHVNERISLDDVCSKVNYSRSFICKTFKEQTGETLFSYFNRMKIDEAQRLLSETSLSVTDIASRLGFSEVKYFCSLFKKLTGTTPVVYRERKGKKQ